MAMTKEQSAVLMNEITFRGRVKVSCLQYADSILIELPSVQGHASRYRWATLTQQQPDQAATIVTPPTVMDSAVQTAGVDEQGKALITDAALQGSVEATVNKML